MGKKIQDKKKYGKKKYGEKVRKKNTGIKVRKKKYGENDVTEEEKTRGKMTSLPVMSLRVRTASGQKAPLGRETPSSREKRGNSVAHARIYPFGFTSGSPIAHALWYLYYSTTIVRKKPRETERKTRGKMTSQKKKNAGKITSLPVRAASGHVTYVTSGQGRSLPVAAPRTTQM